jgi:predicted RNA-binding protein with PUA-like domain
MPKMVGKVPKIKIESKNGKRYWLIKSEADCFSIDDLKKEKISAWSGVRNYQARNFMRDYMKVGDLALFYHSSSNPTGIVGIAKVASKPYADMTAYDPKDEHFDPRALKLKKEAEKQKKEVIHIWTLVDFQFVKKFNKTITLQELKNTPKLKGLMATEKRGSRLSIQPVSEEHFLYITKTLCI